MSFRAFRVIALAVLILLASVGCGSEPPKSAPDAGGGADGSTRDADAEDSGSAGTGGRAGAGTGGTIGGNPAGSGGDAGRNGDAGVGGAPRPACPNRALARGDSQKTLMHGGASREYVLHVPPSYDGTSFVPLVIDLHGFTYSAAHQEGVSGWREKSDAEGFLVAYPSGLGASWNGGWTCCGPSQKDGVDDVGFVRAVVSELRQSACVDEKRVYATGLSNGGALSFLLACNAADVFAATAPISIGNGARPCDPLRPISVVMFRGTSDDLVPYEGDDTYPSALSDLNQWKSLNTCSGSTRKIHGVCDQYSVCEAGAEVMLCTIPNGRHILYEDATNAGASVADVVWEAFERHSLP